MMLGVTFDNLHSYDDLGLILQTVSLPMPTPKVHEVETLGGDGKIDITNYFGETKFSNRIITMVFTDKDPYRLRYENTTTVANNLHGRAMKIIFDEDPQYYYQGRLSVVEEVVDKSVRVVTITADCEPYKYLLDAGNEPWQWDPFSFPNGVIRNYTDIPVEGAADVQVVGGWKTVHPIITSDAQMTVSIDSETATATVPRGTTTIYGISVPYGEHTLHFTGNGNVGIRIQVGTF